MKPWSHATLLQIVVLFAPHVTAQSSPTPLSQTATPVAPSAGIVVTVAGPLVSGQDVTIQCNVNRMPPGSWIEWEYNFLEIGFLSDAYKEGRVENKTMGSTSTLVIKMALRCDSGLYSCCVGEECQEKEVEIGEPPRIVSPPTAPDTHQQGDQISLQCAATGKPALQITWLKNSKKLSDNNQYTITLDNSTQYINGSSVDLVSNLTIKSFSAVNSGSYWCNATNKWGSKTSTPVSLTLQNTSAPFNCKHPPSDFPPDCSGIALPEKPPAVLDLSPSILPGDRYNDDKYPVSVYWNGWTCFGMSQCWLNLDFTCKLYQLKLYPLKQQGKSSNITKLILGGTGVGSDKQPVDRPVEFHPHPGMNMVELTVKVKGNSELRVARSLVLVDNDSKVLTSSSHPLYFSSSNDSSFDLRFQTDLSLGVLTVNWTRHFFNSYINRNPWILYPVHVPSGLNLAKPPLSFGGVTTASHSGIMRYNVSVSQILPSASTYKQESVLLGQLDESYSFQSFTLKGGQAYRADVIVTDIFGHQGNDSVVVYMDDTPPQITKTEIWRRSQPSIKDGDVCKSIGGPSTGNYYSLEFSVSDDESGVGHVDWKVGSQMGGADLGNGTVQYIGGIDKAKCNASPSCSCSLDDFCFNRDRTVELKTSNLLSQSYHVTLLVTSRSALTKLTTSPVSVKDEGLTATTFVNSIKINSPSSSSIHAQWSRLSGAKIYMVTVCTKYDSGECGVCVDTRSASNAITVTGLLPFTRYVVQVQADTASSSILSESRVERTQEGAPTAGPVNIAVIAVNSTALNVSWSHPPAEQRHGIISNYEVRLYRDDQLEQQLSVGSNATVLTVPELRPYTQYSIRIAARTIRGIGPYSPLKTTQTKEAPPGGPPQNVNFTIIGSTSFTITWDSPEASLQYGVITGYDLTYQAQTSQTLIKVPDLKSNNYVTRKNLEPFTLYEISLSASTKAGPGVKFETTIRTAEAAPGPPRIDTNRLDPLGTTSFTISWQPPDRPNGLVTQYIIVVTNASDTQRPNVNSPCNPPSFVCVNQAANHHVVTGLMPDTKYSVSMVAETSSGRGDRTQIYPVKTKPEQLGAPQNLIAKENSSRSINVEWKPPKGIAAKPNYEIVYYISQVDDRDENKKTRQTAKTSILLDRLKPYSYYEIEVSVVGHGGMKNTTSTTFAYTKEDTPGKITTFSVYDVETASIRLYWEPPKDENGRIGYGYHIQDTVSQRPAKSENIQQTDLQPIRNGFQYVVSSLDGDTTYRVSVFAYNIKLSKEGERSDSNTIQTKTGIPGPPSNVRVSATNHTTILVLWEPPTQPNGELKDYEITRSRITENTNDQTSIIYYRVGATARLYEIINVGIGTAYEVTVRAVNRKGQSGERSDPKIVVGKFRRPDLQEPTNVRVLNQTSRGFLVTWQAPNDTNGLQSYNITVTEIGTQRFKQYTVPSSRHLIQLLNLKSDTLYGVTITAIYSDTSRQSPPRFNQTLEGVPVSPPRNFTVRATGSSSVELEWVAPPISDINGQLCRFDVVYHPKENDADNYTKKFEGRHRVGELDGLEAWQEYEVSIAARTCGKEGGTGPSTQTESVRTEEGVPELLLFNGVSRSPRNMSLSWLIKPNGILTMAEIMIINITGTRPKESALSLESALLKESDVEGEYTWTDLMPHTVYTFQLRANTSKGQSVKQLTERTETDVPETSPNLTQCEAQPISGGDVRVSVTFDNIPQDHWNGKPKSYHVTVCPPNNGTKCDKILAEDKVELGNGTKEYYYAVTQQKEPLYFKSSAVNRSLGSLSIRLAGVTSGGKGNYSQQCVFDVPQTQATSSSSSSGAAIAAGVVVPLVILVIALVVFFIWWKRYRALNGRDLDGFPMSDYGDTAGIYSTAKWLTEWPDYGDLQFDRSKLEIIGDLGEGEFGKVHLAVASGIVPKEGKTRVAVKTLKGGSSVETARDFRKELEIMMDFDHPKIIKLLGVCTKEEPLYLITELMTKGDLKEFVRKARPTEASPIGGLSLYELLDISSQVASGMAYLATVKFIHRDVAARNCLVGGSDTELIVKVADFGMAKDVYQSDYYRKKGGILPIRWMAPEAITDGRHTVHSDIWSFGVLMWEIFSFGYQPYFGIENDRVLGGVIGGTLRLQCPPGCPTVVFALMGRCWEKGPDKRITAAELSHNLQDLVHLCKSSGVDIVKQQSADRYQTLRRFASKATTPAFGSKDMQSDTGDDGYMKASTDDGYMKASTDDGYVKPLTNGAPAKSMDGYTQLGSLAEEWENKYEKPQPRDEDVDAPLDPRQFDNPLYNAVIPINQYDLPRQQPAGPKSYVNMSATQPKEGVYDSPAQVETKQESYMDMASTLPRDQTQKESYVGYDSPLNIQPAGNESNLSMSAEKSEYDKPADFQPKEAYVDMGSGATTGKYDDPMMWVRLGDKAKQESYVDMSSSVPQESPPKESYVEMDAAQIPQSDASVLFGEEAKQESYVDMDAAQTPQSINSVQSTTKPHGQTDPSTSQKASPIKVNIAAKLSVDGSKSPESLC